MNTTRTLLVSLALLAPAAVASAAVQPAAPVSAVAAAQEETVTGKIRKVDEGSFVLMVGEEARTITIDADTEYLLDGKQARKADVLKADATVEVQLVDGVAAKVSAGAAG